jgi:hypothetical protein
MDFDNIPNSRMDVWLNIIAKALISDRIPPATRQESVD